MTNVVTSRVPPAVPLMVLATDSSRLRLTLVLNSMVPLDQLVGQLLATFTHIPSRPESEIRRRLAVQTLGVLMTAP
jgi:hypothetical protein